MLSVWVWLCVVFLVRENNSWFLFTSHDLELSQSVRMLFCAAAFSTSHQSVLVSFSHNTKRGKAAYGIERATRTHRQKVDLVRNWEHSKKRRLVLSASPWIAELWSFSVVSNIFMMICWKRLYEGLSIFEVNEYFLLTLREEKKIQFNFDQYWSTWQWEEEYIEGISKDTCFLDTSWNRRVW